MFMLSMVIHNVHVCMEDGHGVLHSLFSVCVIMYSADVTMSVYCLLASASTLMQRCRSMRMSLFSPVYAELFMSES